MLTLIHGADIAASRKYFLDEKEKVNDALLLDAEKVNLTDLTQVFEGGGLFGETKHIFIEQFLTKRKKSGDYKDIIAYLEQHASDHTIYLWENKELEIGTIKALKQPIIKAFKLPQTLFQLLDEVKPGNGAQLVKLFQESIQSAEIEMVFFMLIRQVRLLLALTNETDDPIDEIKRMQPWQRTKLQRQAGLFQTDELLTLYNKLYQLESGQKTGGLNAPLPSAIDFLLLDV